MREIIKKYSSKSLVYIDETGFKKTEINLYVWSLRGKKVDDSLSGKRESGCAELRGFLVMLGAPSKEKI